MASFFQEIDGIMILRNIISMNKKSFYGNEERGGKKYIILNGHKSFQLRDAQPNCHDMKSLMKKG